ncbi:MAG: ABC transporter ATP-binding protein/permease [Rickettsiales bacterium]|jgi:ATP-binding cassette subfamily B protein|nr:ABC transporter ATP-binding protein/permease [Rickettsiales bacterium]
MEKNTQKINEVNVLKSLSPILKKYKWAIIIIFIVNFCIIENIELFATRYLWGDLLNKITDHTLTWDKGFWILFFYVLSCRISVLISIFTKPIQYKVLTSMPYYVINYYYEKLLKNSVSFFNDNIAGTLGAKIARLSSNIKQFVESAMQAGVIVIMIIVGSLISIKYNYKLSIYLFVFLLIFCFIMVGFYKKLLKKKVIISDLDNDLSGRIIDSFSNILNTKIFVKEVFEKGNVKKSITELEVKQNEIYVMEAWRGLFNFVLTIAMQLIILIVLVKDYNDEKINIGDFVFLEGYFITILWWIRRLSELIVKCADFFGKIKSSLEVLENAPSINNSENAKDIILKENPEIEFKNVTFRYKDNLPLVFDKFDLVVNGGEKIGVVGHTGSGKSTFVNILMRFYDVKDGDILINGNNIKNDFTQTSLRKNISYIPQEPILFHRTIRENIIYGDVRATNMQLIEACKKAYCYDFIQELENGFETLVGERGVKLSGGQKQRIAIARAFLKNSSVLILDEATSALDSITENCIQQALKMLMKDKTCFIVAHRLSTLNDVDKILVLQNGRVIEYDTKDVLLKKEDGIFKKMWQMQKNGMIGEDI